jgi:hypothetical protein
MIQDELGSTSGSLRTLSAAAGFSSPDAMSEFYGYDNVPPYTYASLSSGTNAVTTASASGGAMIFSRGINGTQTSSASASPASTNQTISIYSLGNSVATNATNYYKVYRDSIAFRNATFGLYLYRSGTNFAFTNVTVGVSNVTLTSITANGSQIQLYGVQSSSSISTGHITAYFDYIPVPYYQVLGYSNKPVSDPETGYGFAKADFLAGGNACYCDTQVTYFINAKYVKFLISGNYVSATPGWYLEYITSQYQILRYWTGELFSSSYTVTNGAFV